MLVATRGDFLMWAYLLDAMSFAVFEGCVFEALSEVVFELVLPCLAGILALSGQVSSCHPVSDPGAETELPDHRMDLAFCVNDENDVLDGAFVVESSGSCIDPVCSSRVWGKRYKRKSRRCETGTVLCQPRERFYDCCSLFFRYRIV